MWFNTLFFLLVIACISLTFAQVAYDDCCLKYVRKMSPSIRKHAVDYREQVPDGGCNIPAVIFKMKRGRELCTDPKEGWVHRVMKRIDRGRGKPGRKPLNTDPRRLHRG